MITLARLIKNFPYKYFTTRDNAIGVKREWARSNFKKIRKLLKRRKIS